MASLRFVLAVCLLTCTFDAFETSQQKRQRLSELMRKKRSPQTYYNPWTPQYLTAIISIPVQQGLSLWKPHPYQINRPYFVPVLGAPGQQPIYFPPQPIPNNVGYPVDNPPSNAYLPPTPGKDNDTVSTMNKFDGDGDRPVWGMSDGENKVKPTRRPRPPGQGAMTHPPIVRDVTTVSSVPTNKIGTPEQSLSPVEPTPTQNLPSRCVWAIISCCSASSNTISYSCFEQLGCNGAFWGDSPCDNDVARAAISNVMNYYQTK